MKKEAAFYEAIGGGFVRCLLCPHKCVVPEGGRGFCRARSNSGGRLYADGYGIVSGFALDPIEKKPLHHFYPGSAILSVGGFGCNLRCPFCQNHSISTKPPEAGAQPIGAERIAALAREYIPQKNIGAAFTYNEPLVGYEFVFDCARRVREMNMKTVLVTNGFINAEPLMKLLPFIDAMNIDLKSYNGEFYKNINGSLAAVLNTIEAVAQKTHVEITTLVIPDENDGEIEIEDLACFIANVNPEIPLHLSRFFPNHLMQKKSPTPRETVIRLKNIAEKYLRYVYLGNMR